MSQFYIGTSGYNYKHWRERFYPKSVPQKERMIYYAKFFNTVEINATFYRYFPESVFVKWREQTPKNFNFTLKGPRLVSHYKRLLEIDQELTEFVETSAGLEEKLALMLWQFPYSFKKDESTSERLEAFLGKLPTKIPQAFEFRHKSWLTKENYKILDKHGAGFVITDSPRFPTEPVVTGKIAYVRFHGPGRLYSSSYSDEQMANWAKKIRKWNKSRDVFVYFNNDNKGYAIDNARTLKNILGS